MRKIKNLILFTLSIMLLLCCACGKKEEEPILLEPQGVHQDTVAVTRDDVVLFDYYPGYMVPKSEPLLTSSFGEIESVSAFSGKYVEEGEELFRFDSTAMNKEKENLQIELDYTNKDLEIAKKLYDLDLQMASIERDQVLSDIEKLKKEIEDVRNDIDEKTERLNELMEQAETSDQIETDDDSSETIALLENEISDLQLQILQKEEEISFSENSVKNSNLRIEELSLQKKQEEERANKQMEDLNARISKLNEALNSLVVRAPFFGRIYLMNNVLEGGVLYEDTCFGYLVLEDDLYFSVSTYISGVQIDKCQDSYLLIDDERYDFSLIEKSAKEIEHLKSMGVSISTDLIVKQNENTEHVLSEGEFGLLILEKDRKNQVLTLPVNAISIVSKEEAYVYVIENEEKIQKKVSLGITDGAIYEVKSGVEEGDMIYVQH